MMLGFVPLWSSVTVSSVGSVGSVTTASATNSIAVVSEPAVSVAWRMR